MNSYRVQDCLNTFPSSIEQYLRDAGFGGTELLVLRHLLSSGPISTRQLAGKVGKSSSSVDQALHKLMRRSIVLRLEVNGASKFTLGSLDGILHWVEEDTRQKNEELQRRNKSVETFLKTVQKDRSLPEMEHFEGEEGMKTAYRKLLDRGREMLWYLPDPETAGSMEEKFLAQYFRDRRIHKIFTRVLAQDLPYGHQLQMRDAFEHRTTKLMRESRQLFAQEKIIIGDTIACFHHKDQRASFVVYPQLAAMEKSLFDQLWMERATGDSKPKPELEENTVFSDIAGSAKSYFSKKTFIPRLVGYVLLLSTLTVCSYLVNIRTNAAFMRGQVTSIAATGAPQISAEDTNAIRTLQDVYSDSYVRIGGTLNQIRLENPGVKYIYVLRPTDDKSTFEFVVDADAFDPYVKVDFNLDGVIGEEDEPVLPGVSYDVTLNSVLLNRDYAMPNSTPEPYRDQWGLFISGYAPIRDSSGKIVAVLGVDMDARTIYIPTILTFLPAFFMLLATVPLLAFLILRGHASIFRDLRKLISLRSITITSIIVLVVAAGVTYVMYLYTSTMLRQDLSHGLRSIAATVAPNIDPKDLQKIHIARDMATQEYQRVYDELNDIRNQNDHIQYVYVLRRTRDPSMLAFVADADSNYFTGTGSVDDIAPPGTYYDVSTQNVKFLQSFNYPVAISSFYSDEWGTYISGLAPIRDEKNETVAVVGIDMDVSDFITVLRSRFFPWLWFSLSLVVLLTLKLLFSIKWLKTHDERSRK